MTVILLDKDDRLPNLLPPNDKGYWIKRPSAEEFSDCCNEFWWVSTYVAKGLWRKEILYAQEHLSIVRNMLLTMLEWKVGIETAFSVSSGKSAKYLEKYLSKRDWKKMLDTYPRARYECVWKALLSMADFFQETARFVASSCQFNYPNEEYQQVLQYLNHVKRLPSDAEEIYSYR
ncbi:aminoglycoside 6-adenylyltransferase [Oceanobacillus limi]|uniref:Aminoglycoside 6-adenylyltransferase n=1 Tax=Oceanobacillus limi TaxID=930131 RepID=A0A1I0FFZ0_9BACI|nr:aminoglycoside 6-adenylyltransferase [Oceanobacillus limi]SET56460.1 aminoglycoside 6-adenylyltransferase [Oceanobacillus limi]